MLHEEGASTDKTGTFVVSMAEMTLLNGSRTSPEKLKPDDLLAGLNKGANENEESIPNIESTT